MPYHKSLGHPDGQMLFIQFPPVAGKKKWNFVSSLLVKCPGENERKKEKTEKEKEALKRYLLY